MKTTIVSNSGLILKSNQYRKYAYLLIAMAFFLMFNSCNNKSKGYINDDDISEDREIITHEENNFIWYESINNGKHGIVDKYGNVLIREIYDKIIYSYKYVKDDDPNEINFDNEFVLFYTFKDLSGRKMNGMALANKHYEYIVEPGLFCQSISKCPIRGNSSGLCYYKIRNDFFIDNEYKEWSMGIVDKNGDIVVPPIFLWAALYPKNEVIPYDAVFVQHDEIFNVAYPYKTINSITGNSTDFNLTSGLILNEFPHTQFLFFDNQLIIPFEIEIKPYFLSYSNYDYIEYVKSNNSEKKIVFNFSSYENKVLINGESYDFDQALEFNKLYLSKINDKEEKWLSIINDLIEKNNFTIKETKNIISYKKVEEIRPRQNHNSSGNSIWDYLE